MPRMGESTTEHALVKALIIGDGKCGKTDWAVRAAKAGFNLLYLDGDVARATVGDMISEGRLTKEEANRIYLLACGDTTTGGQREAAFYETVNNLHNTAVFRWNDTLNREAKHSDKDSEIWEIRPGRLDHRSVLVYDSWTSLTESIMLRSAMSNSVNIAEATTSEMRPVYQSSGLKATEFMRFIRAMPCHVIVIAHPDEYQHKTAPEGKKIGQVKETELILDWTKLIPKSTSKPHSMQMAKYFTDVLWMGVNATGTEFLVDARMSDSKLSGGHWKERKNTDEYSFANLVKKIGGTLPEPHEPSWIKIITPEEIQATDSKEVTAKPVLNGTVTTQVKGPGLAGFMKKPVATG
jgi:hypothetical protein